ncbi:hypothetical protein C2845_PM13G26220 [Panicum miliaceum]|uniref:Uncharacterized protein n=1 Tax=Panicum miliaceum TaxID=4540 RepID=A0A3L6RGB8_PANMI|nr:hypothetical protein C2845_PM13G26220 [Panicum miliaceum]
MGSSDEKKRRSPFTDITNISILDTRHLDAKELRRQRDILRANALSQEQKDARNKRRREAYAKTKNKNQRELQTMSLTGLNQV